MNRRSAAQLLAELDRDLAAQVFQQLSARDAGRLFGELPTDVAAELTLVLVNDDGTEGQAGEGEE